MSPTTASSPEGEMTERRLPTETEVRYWLAGNLCRCTGYDKIIRAVMDAAAELRQARRVA